MAKDTRFDQYRVNKAQISYNYSVNEQGEVLHRVNLPCGKGLLKTNMELIALGLLNRYNPKVNATLQKGNTHENT